MHPQQSIESLIALIGKNKERGGKSVDPDLFPQLIQTNPNPASTGWEEHIGPYLSGDEWLNFLMFTKEERRYREAWIGVYPEERLSEALTKAEAERFGLQPLRLNYISTDGRDVTVVMPFAAAIDGIALDNTCKATKAMQDFATKIVSEIDSFKEYIEVVRTLMPIMGQEQPKLASMKQDLDGILDKLVEIKHSQEQLVGSRFQESLTSIIDFPQWLKFIMRHKSSNLRAMVLSPVQQDPYMRSDSVPEIQVCTFNHSQLTSRPGADLMTMQDPSNFSMDLTAEVESSFIIKERKGFTKGDLESFLSEGGAFFSSKQNIIDFLIGVGKLEGKIASMYSNADIAQGIKTYCGEKIVPLKDIPNLSYLGQAIGVEIPDSGEKNILCVQPPASNSSPGKVEFAQKLAIAIQFFIGIANIELESKGVGINIGQVLETNQAVRKSLITAIMTALNEDSPVDDAIISGLREIEGIEIKDELADRIKKSFLGKFPFVKDIKEQDEFFVVAEGTPGLWQQSRGHIVTDAMMVSEVFKQGFMESDVSQDFDKSVAGIVDKLELSKTYPDKYDFYERLKDCSLESYQYGILSLFPGLRMAAQKCRSPLTEIATALCNDQLILDEMERLLTNEKSDIEFKSKLGSLSPYVRIYLIQRLLMPAIHCKNPEVVQLLLGKGVDPNKESQYGMMPLELAIESGNPKVVKLLLDAGVNPYRQSQTQKIDFDGMTFFELAIKSGNRDVVEQFLSDRRVDPNKTVFSGEDENGISHGIKPLEIAVESGNPEVVELFLLDQRANPNEKLHDGRTPLGRAIESGNIEVVKLFLLDLRVNLNEKSQNGRTPLELAIELGNREAVKVLRSGKRLHDGPVLINRANVLKDQFLQTSQRMGEQLHRLRRNRRLTDAAQSICLVASCIFLHNVYRRYMD